MRTMSVLLVRCPARPALALLRPATAASPALSCTATSVTMPARSDPTTRALPFVPAASHRVAPAVAASRTSARAARPTRFYTRPRAKQPAPQATLTRFRRATSVRPSARPALSLPPTAPLAKGGSSSTSPRATQPVPVARLLPRQGRVLSASLLAHRAPPRRRRARPVCRATTCSAASVFHRAQPACTAQPRHRPRHSRSACPVWPTVSPASPVSAMPATRATHSQPTCASQWMHSLSSPFRFTTSLPLSLP